MRSIGFVVVLWTANASAMDLQVAAMPLAGQIYAGEEMHSSSGLGLGVSYVQPLRGYTLDVISQCAWSSHTHGVMMSGYPMTRDARVRFCDVVAGASYRLGHPFTVMASSRLGLALGIGAGLRQNHVIDAVVLSPGGNIVRRDANQTSYGWIIQSRVALEYTLRRTSFGVYAAAATTYDSKFVVEPVVGLLISRRIRI